MTYIARGGDAHVELVRVRHERLHHEPRQLSTNRRPVLLFLLGILRVPAGGNDYLAAHALPDPSAHTRPVQVDADQPELPAALDQLIRLDDQLLA